MSNILKQYIGNTWVPVIAGAKGDTGPSGGGTPGGNTGEIQFNSAGSFAGNVKLTYDTATGNVNMGNLQVITSGPNAAAVIRNVNAWDTTRPAPGRIVFGTGYNGDYGNTYDINGFLTRSQVAVWNKYSATQNTQPTINFASALFIDNNTGANITQGSYQSGTFATYVNGPGNFGATSNQNPTAYRGGGTSINVGNATIGNTIVTAAASLSSFTNVGAGSRIVDAIGTYVTWGVNGAGNVSTTTMNNLYGLTFSAGMANTAVSIGNVYLLHNQSGGSGTHNNSWGMNSAARQASRYYFIRNDDGVAQVKLGSLRTYHEYQYTATSSAGALTIDKTNAQIQYVNVTEDITAITLSNFLTALNPGNGNQYQADTVTVIFRQDATGHSITMPTGTAYKYAGGVSAMGSTASAVQMVSITAVYNQTAAATEYLITISPEFV